MQPPVPIQHARRLAAEAAEAEAAAASKAKRWEDAVDAYKRALALRAKDVSKEGLLHKSSLHRKLAASLFRCERYDEATQSATRGVNVLRVAPRSAATVLLGWELAYEAIRCHQKKQRYDRVLQKAGDLQSEITATADKVSTAPLHAPASPPPGPPPL